MAIANGKAATGEAIKDNIRKVDAGRRQDGRQRRRRHQGDRGRRKVDYAGASGPCDFDEKGDILDCKFRYEQIKAGKFTLVKIA